jgi:hypothetical protein
LYSWNQEIKIVQHMRILVSLGLLLICFFGNGQLALRTGLVSPTGYLGAVVKKAPFISIGKISELDGRFRNRMMGELCYFSPRKDRFDIYASVIEGNEETIFPGTQEINLYMNLAFSFGYDYKVLEKDAFNWFLGFDAVAGLTLRQYNEDVPYVVSGGDFSGLPYIGLRGRTGVEYAFDKFTLFVDVSRTYYLNSEAFLLNYNDLGLGIRF